MPIKQLVAGSAALSGVGLLAVIVLQVLSGLEYRAAEQAGLEPGNAPEWIVLGTNAGLVVLAVGIISLVVSAVLLAVRKKSETELLTPQD
ncbi:hypothetical protein EQW78_12845 [Oerskovia turbata]|uniref:Uncharacterized protein n=1 Tax=Oerskovia turbata TaxID=1713 RepID=A0A4V1N4P4_9CELL|nr:hypothetical protein [Oerskovia turbata]RXR23606.1 hypothetical protein EQW73_14865 [Oerskovia turbata]RXR32876.1 hypothetical protein EQW78_12845 [Oerskovia turbata]